MNSVSLIMDDGSYITKVLDDNGRDEYIDMFRNLMGSKYDIELRHNEIMALDGDKFVMSMEWREAMPV